MSESTVVGSEVQDVTLELGPLGPNVPYLWPVEAGKPECDIRAQSRFGIQLAPPEDKASQLGLYNGLSINLGILSANSRMSRKQFDATKDAVFARATSAELILHNLSFVMYSELNAVIVEAGGFSLPPLQVANRRT